MADAGSTKWYRVYPDEDAPRDRPWGLYRRVWDGERVVGKQAYHPDTGWHQTDYWLSIKWRGEPDSFLLEVDEQQALRTRRSSTRSSVDVVGRDDPNARPGAAADPSLPYVGDVVPPTAGCAVLRALELDGLPVPAGFERETDLVRRSAALAAYAHAGQRDKADNDCSRRRSSRHL